MRQIILHSFCKIYDIKRVMKNFWVLGECNEVLCTLKQSVTFEVGGQVEVCKLGQRLCRRARVSALWRVDSFRPFTCWLAEQICKSKTSWNLPWTCHVVDSTRLLSSVATNSNAPPKMIDVFSSEYYILTKPVLLNNLRFFSDGNLVNLPAKWFWVKLKRWTKVRIILN